MSSQTEKKYTSANECQLHMKAEVIKNVTQSAGDNWDIQVTHETVYEFNGKLAFVIKKVAKEGTGMLFLADRSWFVLIGRKGGVKSMDTISNGRPRTNKYLIF